MLLVWSPQSSGPASHLEEDAVTVCFVSVPPALSLPVSSSLEASGENQTHFFQTDHLIEGIVRVYFNFLYSDSISGFGCHILSIGRVG